MSKRGDPELLADILEAIRRVETYLEGQGYDGFVTDIKTQDAVVRALEIAGEASKRISPTLRDEHPEIPWKSMAGLRDKLIHDYFGVNLDVVWEVASQELPALAAKLLEILRQRADAQNHFFRLK